MATKRKKTTEASSSSTPRLNRAKFMSLYAQQKFNNSLLQQRAIPERGFVFEADHINYHSTIADQHGWRDFCAQPEPGVMAIVREFYANFAQQKDNKVYVRGKYVAFDRDTINSIYGVRSIEEDEYSAYANEWDAAQVLDALAILGIQWKQSKDGVASFPYKALRHREAKAWYYFVSSRLMPTSHRSDVTKDRAILLYCIQQGHSIDIGRIIQQNIEQCGRSKSTGALFFPCLVTQLCKKAKVVWDPTIEELCHPTHALDNAHIRIFKLPRSQQSHPQEAQEEEEMIPHGRITKERIAQLERKVRGCRAEIRESFQHTQRDFRALQHSFDDYRKYHMQWHEHIAQLMQTCAIHSGLDPATLPSMPTYAEASTSDQTLRVPDAMEEEEDEEDDGEDDAEQEQHM